MPSITDKYLHAELSTYIEYMGLPSTFVDRDDPESVDDVAKVMDSLDTPTNRRRRFLLGVYPSFVVVAELLCEQTGKKSIPNALTAYPPQEQVAGGGMANSLTLGDPPISLRTTYNNVEKIIRHDLQRADYPNCAPHATQSWSQYRDVFEDICAMTPEERTEVMRLLWQRILDLPLPQTDSEAVREIRPFEYIIENFRTAQREPPGVILQALAYAYYRADSPNVTFRPYKVGSGSSRVGAAGDVDGWIGRSLALSVEVKDKDITEDNLEELDQFELQLMQWPNCTAVVLANSFTDDAIEYLKERNILSFDRTQMTRNVSFWDVPKQKLAVRELYYYFSVIQQNTRLVKRFEDFCSDAGISLASS